MSKGKKQNLASQKEIYDLIDFHIIPNIILADPNIAYQELKTFIKRYTGNDKTILETIERRLDNYITRIPKEGEIKFGKTQKSQIDKFNDYIKILLDNNNYPTQEDKSKKITEKFIKQFDEFDKNKSIRQNLKQEKSDGYGTIPLQHQPAGESLPEQMAREKKEKAAEREALRQEKVKKAKEDIARRKAEREAAAAEKARLEEEEKARKKAEREAAKAEKARLAEEEKAKKKAEKAKKKEETKEGLPETMKKQKKQIVTIRKKARETVKQLKEKQQELQPQPPAQPPAQPTSYIENKADFDKEFEEFMKKPTQEFVDKVKKSIDDDKFNLLLKDIKKTNIPTDINTRTGLTSRKTGYMPTTMRASNFKQKLLEGLQAVYDKEKEETIKEKAVEKGDVSTLPKKVEVKPVSETEALPVVKKIEELLKEAQENQELNEMIKEAQKEILRLVDLEPSQENEKEKERLINYIHTLKQNKSSKSILGEDYVLNEKDKIDEAYEEYKDTGDTEKYFNFLIEIQKQKLKDLGDEQDRLAPQYKKQVEEEKEQVLNTQAAIGRQGDYRPHFKNVTKSAVEQEISKSAEEQIRDIKNWFMFDIPTDYTGQGTALDNPIIKQNDAREELLYGGTIFNNYIQSFDVTEGIEENKKFYEQNNVLTQQGVRDGLTEIFYEETEEQFLSRFNKGSNGLFSQDQTKEEQNDFQNIYQIPARFYKGGYTQPQYLNNIDIHYNNSQWIDNPNYFYKGAVIG